MRRPTSWCAIRWWSTATLPRFLLMGDKSTLRLDLDNVEGETGDYQIAVTTDGPFTVENADKTLPLDAKKRGGGQPARLGDRRR